MTVVSVSQDVFSQVELALSDSFNLTLASTCNQFDIADSTFSIDFNTPGSTYFRAGYTLQWMRDVVEAQGWPILCLFVVSATDEHQQLPCIFQGPVSIGIAIYIRTEGRAPADLETLPNAIESTLLTILYGVNGNICMRQGSLVIERAEPEWLNSYWWQGIHATAEFEITV